MALLVSQTTMHRPFAMHLVITPDRWASGYGHPMGWCQVGYKSCYRSLFRCLSTRTAHESMSRRSKSTASEQTSSYQTASIR